MKHITTIFLSVLLIVALAVPAFATEAETYTLDGEWTFNETLNSPSEVWESDSGNYFTEKFSGAEYLDKTCYQLTYFHSGTLQYRYWNGVGYSDGLLYRFDEHTWASDSRFITFDNTEVSASFYAWFTANASPAVCDGSTCPATDANADGVCDDCGMVLSLRLTGYPTLPVVDGSNQHSVLTSDSGGYSYYVYYSPSSYTIEGIAGDQLLAKFSSNVNWKVFRCTDGRNWAENASSSGYQYGMGYASDVTILSSSFDFYDESGNLFFPLPLWVEMGQMTEGEMGALTAETAGTMRTLAVCGVGLIALLVVLSLFGKRSLIFHN